MRTGFSPWRGASGACLGRPVTSRWLRWQGPFLAPVRAVLARAVLASEIASILYRCPIAVVALMVDALVVSADANGVMVAGAACNLTTIAAPLHVARRFGVETLNGGSAQRRHNEQTQQCSS